MNNDHYLRFEAVVMPAIYASVSALLAEMQRTVPSGSTLSDLESVDHDIERGFGFTINSCDDARVIGVEMMLADGDERGFDDEARPAQPAAGIMMSVTGPGGLYLGEFSPGNYTPEVGSADPEVLARRAAQLDPVQGAEFILECMFKLDRQRISPGQSQ